ncbi:hypothetical protein KIK84_13590 [Curvibacter sp. CHRR-16]|uniref:hypothetical protein n=1 Tax=Curvibacter sp. CHRR-16 TaxID=2835872 RepID=UPI001BDA2E30|nr:hypothetical protein [Curvibacter sp. CHRR-16]MBT0571362.1 hypothetical protein [Curvibacter sp. CHRR-16]
MALITLAGYAAIALACYTGLAWVTALLLLLLQTGLTLQAYWVWFRTQPATLAWTGQGWQHGGAGLQYVVIDGDWQRLLLLRTVSETGRWRWLVLQADWYSPAHWHSLRSTLILAQTHE